MDPDKISSVKQIKRTRWQINNVSQLHPEVRLTKIKSTRITFHMNGKLIYVSKIHQKYIHINFWFLFTPNYNPFGVISFNLTWFKNRFILDDRLNRSQLQGLHFSWNISTWIIEYIIIQIYSYIIIQFKYNDWIYVAALIDSIQIYKTEYFILKIDLYEFL